MFDQFHQNECVLSYLLSYFVALIPKVSLRFTLGDFRPISLLRCLYKLLAKVSAARLAREMNLIVSSEQSTFLTGGI